MREIGILDLATLVCALGCGQIAGAFFAFSPRNNALAVVAPSRAEAARPWTSYLSTWTAWNHVRTLAAIAAAAAFTLALLRRA